MAGVSVNLYVRHDDDGGSFVAMIADELWLGRCAGIDSDAQRLDAARQVAEQLDALAAWGAAIEASPAATGDGSGEGTDDA